MIKDCLSEDDFDRLVSASEERPVFLFKHSTTCPISKGAWERFTGFAEEAPAAEYWRVLARENRKLSRRIAEATDIGHQSPQVILFYGGRAIWKASHRAINAETLGRQLKRILK